MMNLDATTRYTTREIAQRLGCCSLDAMRLLKAAKIPHDRCGGAYLWHGPEVERLLNVLTRDEPDLPKND